MKPPTEMVQLFRGRGLKVTPQRECIFEALWSAGTHPTAEDVFVEARRRLPTMSLKTIYQTLHDLADMGEIRQLDLGTGSSRFDPIQDAHHHLVCGKCGQVRDLYADFALQVAPVASQGFSLGGAEVVFRGLCADCRSDLDPPPQPLRSQPLPALRDTRTFDNLREAFARQSQASHRYLYFAQKADIEGYPELAALLRSVADGEAGHAFGHLDFLAEVGDPLTGAPVGGTADNLRSAIEGERFEYGELYPSFARIARQEGLDDVAEWFESVARAETSHVDRLTAGLAHLP
jgi:Fe2+ or Zn2+ uptake regulation protein/rubrerythrin